LKGSPGFAQAHPEVIRMIRFEVVSFVVFALSAIPLNLWMARRYQKTDRRAGASSGGK
jgi:hypothetical protein